MTTQTQDIAVVGGGIVGLATAMTLLDQRPSLKVALLEKEDRLGLHQTGHNSGVIHSGIYYQPGSLKASLCLQGGRALMDYCDRNRIRTERCGKVIVATAEEELPRLAELHRRAQANGVPGVASIPPERLRELEPHAAGLRALHVPSTALVNFRQVAESFGEKIRSAGGTILPAHWVRRIKTRGREILLQTPAGEISALGLINCGGLHADRIARQISVARPPQIIPFRGEYYELIPERRGLVRSLIYPVPDPRFPFLGVHFTRRIDGRVDAGPNAVLAFKREGYRRSDFNLLDCAGLAAFPGFWKMAARYWRTGLQELARSWSKRLFVQDLRRLVPELQEQDLLPAESGVRAQAVDRSGALLDDFCIIQEGPFLHVCNAPSPAATAALAIAREIVSRIRGG